jgi:PAS domain S-box-containing protein
LMRPMISDESCLKCHAVQGYEAGDVRGGVGVSVPLQSLYALSKPRYYTTIFGYLGFWLLILCGIGYFWVIESIQVRERHDIQQTLRESEERFSLFMNNLPGIIFIKDEDSKILYTNQYMKDIYGTADWLGKMPFEIFPEQVANKIIGDDKKSLASGFLETVENIPDKHGINHIYKTRRFCIKRSSKPNLLGGIALDITEQKQVEDKVIASLQEKELLLQEVHHRVKNNMQIISSLLKLQADDIRDDKTVNVLNESQGRIYAMAAVHEMLYKSEKLSEIDIKLYLHDIAGNLSHTYSIDPQKVKINIESDEIMLNLDIAIPLGLTVVELLSNSIKYAFPNEMKGRIDIILHKLDGEFVEVIVKDNGFGMSEKIDWQNCNTLGLKLVQTLVEGQLGGSIDMQINNGTRFIIKFNMDFT